MGAHKVRDRLRCADVPGPPATRTGRLATLAAVFALTAASAAFAVLGTSAPGSAGDQGVASERLDTRVHQALLGLYALDSQLQASQARLGTLETAAAGLRTRQATLRQALGVARSTLRVAQGSLANHLRALYEGGNVDPVAVVLGATSLSAALRRLDDLTRMADQDRRIVATTVAAHTRLLQVRARLAVQSRRLARSLAAAREEEQTLAQAAAARHAFVASLQARERLQAAQVQTIVATAGAAQQRSQGLQAPTPTPTAPPPSSGDRTLVVSATCYDLPGRTATGMPVGWGVVAVDPSVIPLGTRMHVPGYGDGVAADVGSGIQGAVIDLWMPPAQCAAWGRRTVTITLY